MNNALFKQWVGIFLTPKIDRAHKNYLTPEIWEETHLREIFYGTLIFQQSSVICIGRHVGGHTLSLVLYCNFAPQHCAEQAPPEFLLLKYLLWEKYCNYPLTTTLGDRFASCENILSRSQTSSLPPPPLALKTTLCLYLVERLIITLRCAVNVTRSSFLHPNHYNFVYDMTH